MDEQVRTHTGEDGAQNESVLIWVNGRLLSRAEAVVSVYDAGFMLGNGVWEGLRLYRGRWAFLDEHLDRLFQAAKAIDLDIGRDRAALAAALEETRAANGMETDAHARLMVTRGVKSRPFQHPGLSRQGRTTVIIMEHSRPSIPQPIRLATVPHLRGLPMTRDPKLNSHSKLNCILGCIAAAKAGADEALMLDVHGFVNTAVEVLSGSLALSGPDACEGRSLWKLEGEGVLRISGEQFRIQTSAETDAPQATLALGGDVLTGWRSAHDGSLVLIGEPRCFSSRDGGPQRLLSRSELSVRQGRGMRFGERIAAWNSGGDACADPLRCPARNRTACIARSRAGEARLRSRRSPPGSSRGPHRRECRGDGSLGRRSVDAVARGPRRAARHRPVRLWSAQTGADLALVAPWPARAGMILDPEGNRLAQQASRPACGCRT